ncbi:MAG TPA: hypothetical protein GX739_01420 [Firmicutes bacterium]|nr:hypothetical protein [Bacillota bacterium]
MTKKRFLFLFVLLMALGLSGCFSFFSKTPYLKVVPESVVLNLATGETEVELTAEVVDLITDEQITWEIADAAVATLSEETGAQVKVVAQAVGETTITVSCGELEPVTVSVKVVHDEKALPLVIDFAEAERSTFFTAEYTHAPNMADEPLCGILSSGSKIQINAGVFSMNGARWAIGAPSTYLEGGIKTTKEDSKTVGYLDLSKPYAITIEFGEAVSEPSGFFQIMVDNNTTTEANSIHGMASSIYQINVSDIKSNDTLVIKSDLGTAASFIQFRTNSGAQVNIKRISIDYQ